MLLGLDFRLLYVFSFSITYQFLHKFREVQNVILGTFTHSLTHFRRLAQRVAQHSTMTNSDHFEFLSVRFCVWYSETDNMTRACKGLSGSLYSSFFLATISYLYFLKDF